MNIILAKEITRKFTKNGEFISPILASDWEFLYIEDKVYLGSEEQNESFYFSTTTNYLKNYIFGDKKDLVLNNKLVEDMYFTSKGLVSTYLFYEAEDFMENIEYIKLKDMEDGAVYESEKGIKYLFIKRITRKHISYIDNNYTKLYVRENKKENLLHLLNKDKIINFNSIKIVKKVEEQRLNLDVLEDRVYFGSNDIYGELNYSFLEGKTFHNNIDSYLKRYEIKTKEIIRNINTFINSNETSFSFEHRKREEGDFIAEELVKYSTFFIDQKRDEEFIVNLQSIISEIFFTEYLDIDDLIKFFDGLEDYHDVYFTRALLNIYSVYKNMSSIKKKLKEFQFKDKSKYRGEHGEYTSIEEIMHYMEN